MTGTDNQLIDLLAKQAADGDREAFSRLMKLKMNSIFALTYRMTADRQTAEDLTQESFIKAWQKLPTFRWEAGFSSWLYRISTNLTLNHLDKASVRSEVLLDDIESSLSQFASRSPNPEQSFDQKRSRQKILKFMSSLPEAQRLVFDLRFFGQRSFSEISDATGRAIGTVKTNYRQAVLKLKQLAEKEGWAA